MKTKIAIIGAGASGLFSSILLSSRNYDVTIFEKNNKVGKKLLITGNGRCNITNKNISLKYFHSQNKEFIKHPLEQFTYESCKNFFSDLGIEFIQGAKTRQYPMSQTASSVVDLLEYQALKNGVKISLNTEITTIDKLHDKFLINKKDKFDKVVLSTGSIAMPRLGSSSIGYDIAEKFGHKIIKPFASLVQLVASNKNLDMIAGVKIDGVINGIQGDILFTKYGVSGSAILDISRDISQKLQNQRELTISIDTMPTFSKEQLTNMLLQRLKKHSDKELFMWLDGIMNKKLARYIITNSNIPKHVKHTKFLTKKDVLSIVNTIKNLSFTIVNTKGFETCEVCAGGVDTKEVDTRTMQSKKQKGLYLIGEVLDVDGSCGGYNLHWAWASGYVLANSMN